MFKPHGIEKELRQRTEQISETYGGAHVLVIVAGSAQANVPRCMIDSTLRQEGYRLRDLLGVLETAIQIETLRHFFRSRGQPGQREGSAKPKV
jgi:hypothetical protein